MSERFRRGEGRGGERGVRGGFPLFLSYQLKHHRNSGKTSYYDIPGHMAVEL